MQSIESAAAGVEHAEDGSNPMSTADGPDVISTYTADSAPASPERRNAASGDGRGGGFAEQVSGRPARGAGAQVGRPGGAPAGGTVPWHLALWSRHARICVDVRVGTCACAGACACAGGDVRLL